MDLSIADAMEFAHKVHSGQTRKYTGNPYVFHPVQVASLVASYNSSDEVIAAAYLHDVLEDCDVSEEELKDRFGPIVTKLCRELVNQSLLPEYKYLRRIDRKSIDRDKIAIISAEAQLIKACDRLDNLRDLHYAPGDYKKLYAKESLLLADVLTKAPTDLVTMIRDQAYAILGTKE